MENWLNDLFKGKISKYLKTQENHDEEYKGVKILNSFIFKDII